jgi:hypothetical protein
LLFFILLVTATRRVSIGSMGGAAVLIPAVWLTTNDPGVIGAALLIVMLILFRHTENIKRLMAGKEPPLDKRHWSVDGWYSEDIIPSTTPISGKLVISGWALLK